jgi:hypothetical protein
VYVFNEPETPMRVALYLRVSTSAQTVENQERELAAVAAARGWQVVETLHAATNFRRAASFHRRSKPGRRSRPLAPDMPSSRYFDASRHRPHYVAIGDEALKDARRRAEDAYEARNVWLQDAWRGPGSTAPPDPREGESPRDAYIRRLGEAWKTPPGSVSAPDDDDHPNPVEAQRRRWLSPGATPGTTKDAAISDRAAADEAYRNYVDRIANAWRAR